MSKKTVDNQDISKGSTKANAGKAPLELRPPAYWMAVDSELSIDMSLWYFYHKPLIEITDKRIAPYDGIEAWELGASKYTSHNWLNGGLRWGAIVGAFHRHVNKFDEISGLWLPRDMSEINIEYNSKGEELARYPHGCAVRWAVEALNEYSNRGLNLGENDCAWHVNKEAFYDLNIFLDTDEEDQ